MLETHQPGLGLDLAEQTLLSCDTTGGCNGGTGLQAAAILQDRGATTEACQPYRGNDTAPCNEDCDRTYAISGYQRILPVQYPEPTPTPAEMIEILKNHLALYGPLWTSMMVYDEFYDYRSGIYAITDTPGILTGGHAILLIGYDDTQSAFIVKNSWGTGWGEAGFFRIAYGEVESAVEFGAYTYVYGDPVDLAQEPPTAEAGGDQTVDEGAEVTLDGTASSDPDGEITGYQWRQVSGPSVTLSGANTARPSFIAPDLLVPVDAELVFELTVTDDDDLTATDRITVTVTWANDAPTARAGADRRVAERTLVDLDGGGSDDPEGETLTYRWTQISGPPVTLTGAATARASFTTPNLATAADAQLVFQLTVNDPHGGRDTDRVTITVIWVNDAPEADAGDDRSVAEGTAVGLEGTGSNDPEGEPLTYRWVQVSGPPVTLADADTAQAGFTAPNLTASADAQMVFELTVTDPHGASDRDQVTITIRWENDAPTATAGEDQNVEVGDLVTLDAGASSDPDDGIAAYAWRQVSGPQVALSAPGEAQTRFTAPANGEATPLQLRFELKVTDHGGLEASDSVDVWIAPQVTTPDGAPQAPSEPTDPADPQEPETPSPPEDGARGDEVEPEETTSGGGGGGGCFISQALRPWVEPQPQSPHTPR
jgi:hypothetical protein